MIQCSKNLDLNILKKFFKCNNSVRYYRISTKNWLTPERATKDRLCLQLIIKFFEIQWISFWVILAAYFMSHTYADTHAFSRNNQIIDIAKHLNTSKTGSQNFSRTQFFLLFIEKKGKKKQILKKLVPDISRLFSNKSVLSCFKI